MDKELFEQCFMNRVMINLKQQIKLICRIYNDIMGLIFKLQYTEIKNEIMNEFYQITHTIKFLT